MRWSIVTILFVTGTCLAGPEFLGTLTTGERTLAAIRISGDDGLRWVGVGDLIGDCRVSLIDAKGGRLVLSQSGHPDVELTLKDGSIKSLPTLRDFAALERSDDRTVKGAYLRALALEKSRAATVAEIEKLRRAMGANAETSESMTMLKKDLLRQDVLFNETLIRLSQLAVANAKNGPK